MKKLFLTTSGSQFTYNGAPVRLYGVGLGNWLNLEHFMLGFPGTDAQIRHAFTTAYGAEQADRFWSRYYECYTDEADIAFVGQTGMNLVRIALNHHLFDENEFQNSIALREIDRVLSCCQKHRVWALLDMHTAPGGQNPDWHSDNPDGVDRFWGDEQAQKQMIELWRKIADYYRDEQWIAGYDLLNEPCYFKSEYNKTLIDFYSELTQQIRSVDSNHILFYEGNTYARDFSMFHENLDDNCAYTFHMYPFLQFPDKLDASDLRTLLQQGLDDVSMKRLQSLNRPLLCGETGHPHHLDHHVHALSLFLDVLEKEHISWALWPLKDCGAMGILYPTQNSMWHKLIQELTENWNFWDSFTKDSILAVEDHDSRYAFYQGLIRETTRAWQIFSAHLIKTDFEQLYEALYDFQFKKTRRSEPLLSLISEHINAS